MGKPKRRRSDLAGRPAMRSPGRPPVGRREHRQRFWAAIARGLGSEAAGIEAGVSPAVGVRWFREGGGMPTVTSTAPAVAHRQIARRVGTISPRQLAAIHPAPERCFARQALVHFGVVAHERLVAEALAYCVLAGSRMRSSARVAGFRAKRDVAFFALDTRGNTEAGRCVRSA